jgi:hypothetical protein
VSLAAFNMSTNDESTIPGARFRYVRFRDRYDSLRRIVRENQWYFGSCADFDDADDSRVPGVVYDRAYLRKLLTGRFGLTASGEFEIDQFLGDPKARLRVTAQVQNYVNNIGILCLVR